MDYTDVLQKHGAEPRAGLFRDSHFFFLKLHAEKEMNQYAKEHWTVKAVTHWETSMSYRLVITFERTVEC